MKAAERFDSSEDTAAAWARRKENIREALKLFRLVTSAVKKHAAITEEQCQISSTRLRALHEISKNPGMRGMDLAKSMAIHASAASRIAEALLLRGLVRNGDSGGDDNKTIRMFLTDQGMALLANTPFPSQGILTDALENIDGQVLAELTHAMQQVVDTMRFRDNQAALTPLTEILQMPANPGGYTTSPASGTRGESNVSTN